jgi:hypothetical protein
MDSRMEMLNARRSLRSHLNAKATPSKKKRYIRRDRLLHGA